MKKTDKIKENMTIEEVVRNFPETLPVFQKYGLHCIGCPMAAPETVGEAAKVHGMKTDEFLKELNEAAK
jgi:hybrid cluster-associated redox disulfide protein